jgi:ectoine hydroxylase-related dioxygenase (phytanoyl-CoA dioxygenase family)
MPLNLGDVTAHSGWVLHSAGANTGTEDRLALAVSYVDADARVRKGWDEFDGDTGHGEDYLSYGGWVKDVKVGKRIKHPNVPIIKW